MISTKLLEQKINELIDGGNLTDLQITQLSGAVQSLENSSFLSVATFSDLPDVELNLGRLVYVVDEEKFYFSDGQAWTNDFSTETKVAKTIAYAWGSNAYLTQLTGMLGDGTTDNRSSPVTVIGGITNWKQLSAGQQHSLGITDNGIAYAWGRNSGGRLGDGTTIWKSSPVTVIGGITNWSRLNAGRFHSFGVTDDGIAYAWGINGDGQLGDGTTTTKSSPVTVIGGITNWKQVSASSAQAFMSHSLGLTDDGIAYAWGSNDNGQLGDGTTTTKSSPVTVIGGITNWKQVSAGNYHSLGLTDSGILYSWGGEGYFNRGQLGHSTSNDKSSPVTVIGGITNWSQVSADNNVSLGLTDDGIAYAWGWNIQGRLGDGTTEDRSSPVTVIGGITNWSQLSAGGYHSLGITDDGVAYAWGSNGNSQLGDGTTIDRSSPVTVVGNITNWSQVSAGNIHNFGLEAQTKGFEEA